jgi:hypothetical protein
MTSFDVSICSVCAGRNQRRLAEIQLDQDQHRTREGELFVTCKTTRLCRGNSSTAVEDAHYYSFDDGNYCWYDNGSWPRRRGGPEGRPSKRRGIAGLQL